MSEKPTTKKTYKNYDNRVFKNDKLQKLKRTDNQNEALANNS